MYEGFLSQLAQASGIDTPTPEDLARLDRKRPKKGCNEMNKWHPVELAVDLETTAGTFHEVHLPLLAAV
jgi:hypothetical protein